MISMRRAAPFLAAAVLLVSAGVSQEARIRSVRVSAPDVTRTAQFYETVFGLREARHVDRNGAPFEVILNYGKDAAAAEANTAPKLVVILRDPAAPPPSVSNLVFGVRDVEAIVARAMKAGGTQSRQTSVSQTSGSKVGFIKDPAGNEIELIQEKTG
jgi:predicted enzyme related to lactoylglutathione lyase